LDRQFDDLLLLRIVANGTLQVFDGVAFIQRGDVALCVYGSDARVHRTRWLFDRADECVRNVGEPDGILILFLIPPSAAPPDAATRAENSARFKKVFPSIRRFVTVPLGDALRVSIVKAVMRAMILVQRQIGRHVIASTEADGITRLLERAGPDTPNRAAIEADLRSLWEALDKKAAKAS
jgi:hypothetical protein